MAEEDSRIESSDNAKTASALAETIGPTAAGALIELLVPGAGLGVKLGLLTLRTALGRMRGERAQVFLSLMQAQLEAVTERHEVEQSARDAAAALLRDGISGEEFAAIDGRIQQAVYENFRRAVDCIDPVVVPALARLTGLYADRVIDRVFRDTGRLLQDMDGAEYDILVELAAISAGPSGDVALSRSESACLVTRFGGPLKYKSVEITADVKLVRAFINRLVSAGLAEPHSGLGSARIPGSEMAYLREDIITVLSYVTEDESPIP